MSCACCREGHAAEGFGDDAQGRNTPSFLLHRASAERCFQFRRVGLRHLAYELTVYKWSFYPRKPEGAWSEKAAGAVATLHRGAGVLAVGEYAGRVPTGSTGSRRRPLPEPSGQALRSVSSALASGPSSDRRATGGRGHADAQRGGIAVGVIPVRRLARRTSCVDHIDGASAATLRSLVPLRAL